MSEPIAVLTASALRALLVEAAEEGARRALEARPEAAGEWLSAAEAAALLRCHADTLGRMARSGRLPAERLGRHYRFRRGDLLAFMKEG